MVKNLRGSQHTTTHHLRSTIARNFHGAQPYDNLNQLAHLHYKPNVTTPLRSSQPPAQEVRIRYDEALTTFQSRSNHPSYQEIALHKEKSDSDGSKTFSWKTRELMPNSQKLRTSSGTAPHLFQASTPASATIDISPSRPSWRRLRSCSLRGQLT